MAEQGSPLWWVLKLDKMRRDRALRLSMLRRYASGDHPLPEASQRWRDYYRSWQKRARTNYCGLASASVAERLQVTGFTGGSELADSDLWRLWKRYRLDADADLVHHAQTDLGVAYVLVGPDRVSPESPFQVITYSDPADPRLIVAGLKCWTDMGVRYAKLYAPGEVYTFTAPDPESWQDLDDLEWRQSGVVETNPLGRVPIVPFHNRPTLDRDYLAEFEDAIDVQDRINSLMLHMLTISQSQAFRQRYVKGLMTEDEDGNPVDPPFEALVSALWVVEDTDVEFGEFQQVDLTPLLRALQESITQFVTITGLPPHYVAGDLVNASADALAAAEARLVAKVRARQRVAGESWEDVMRLAAAWQGVDVAEDVSVLWADPERKTDAQLSDAVLKSAQYGVPWEQRMIDRGYTPPQIERMRTQVKDEMRLDAERAAMTARLALGDDGADTGSAPADTVTE
jgi:hypothetical protein